MINNIRNEINDYIYTPVEIVDGHTFDTYDTIKRIHLYENRLFEDDSQYMGIDKLFFDATKPRQEQVARYLDVDTKDVVLRPTRKGARFRTKLLEHELRGYMDKHNFGEKFNDIADYLTTYGTVVLKTISKTPELLDLRNLFFDPTVENIVDSRFIIIKHNLNSLQLRKYAKENGWDMDAVERMINKKEEAKQQGDVGASPYEDNKTYNRVRSTTMFEVYERWGVAKRSDIVGGKDDTEVNSLYVIAEPFFTGEKDGASVDLGEVLYKSEWKGDLPFIDTHLLKIQGRYLGVGIYELLFTPQERINELSNQRRISMELSSIHLFQTSDKTAIRNLRTDYMSGDVVKTKQSGITPIANEERNLSAFSYDEQQYTKLADALSKANEMILGSDMPATTTATGLAISNNNFVKVQMRRKQNFTQFISRYIRDFVLPQVLKEVNIEHVIAFDGDYEEVSAMQDRIATLKANQKSKEAILKGKLLPREAYEFILAQEREGLTEDGNVVYVRALRDSFKDMSYDLRVMADNESEDVAMVHNNYMEHLRIIANNPGLLDDPVAKEVYMDVAGRSGIDTARLEIAMQKRKAQPQQSQRVNQAELQSPTNE